MERSPFATKIITCQRVIYLARWLPLLLEKISASSKLSQQYSHSFLFSLGCVHSFSITCVHSIESGFSLNHSQQIYSSCYIVECGTMQKFPPTKLWTLSSCGFDILLKWRNAQVIVSWRIDHSKSTWGLNGLVDFTTIYITFVLCGGIY